mmetsp:Transcript_3567/g.9852  ORF Transcript_3567/g.9852 Transcript_3567/m.9852 type:complete len:103 (-) Transcript_3567:2-310(-)
MITVFLASVRPYPPPQGRRRGGHHYQDRKRRHRRAAARSSRCWVGGRQRGCEQNGAAAVAVARMVHRVTPTVTTDDAEKRCHERHLSDDDDDEYDCARTTIH